MNFKKYLNEKTDDGSYYWILVKRIKGKKEIALGFSKESDMKITEKEFKDDFYVKVFSIKTHGLDSLQNIKETYKPIWNYTNPEMVNNDAGMKSLFTKLK